MIFGGTSVLVFDFYTIGNKLFHIRKTIGMTQADVAEAAGLSDRTYADIERGTVNMRIETLLRICAALHITPNEILVEEDVYLENKQIEVLEKLNRCNEQEKETALNLLNVYLDSLK